MGACSLAAEKEAPQSALDQDSHSRKLPVNRRALRSCYNAHAPMSDEEIRAEIARQVPKTLVQLANALRSEAAQPGGPVARITLGRAADAIQKLVDGR